MNENPYKTPCEVAAGESSAFLRLPTILEWIVIAIVAIVAMALFLPDPDEGVQAARKKYEKQPAVELGEQP